MLAFALREMRITEEQFWDMTPLKFNTLLEATCKVIQDLSPFGGSSKSTSSNGTKVINTTVDNIPGWD